MKKCVIMGNGPGLNEMPPETLLQMDSFGVNYCPHSPTYYVCVDHDVLVNHHREIYPIAAGAKNAFLAAKEYQSSDIYDLPNIKLITHDTKYFVDEHFFSGLTVVYVALKVAFYLGYQRVHLWGVDHSADWEHYRPDYPPGDKDRRKWRMQEMEYHYKLANRVYTLNGRRIINHSHHSKLDEIFARK